MARGFRGFVSPWRVISSFCPPEISSPATVKRKLCFCRPAPQISKPHTFTDTGTNTRGTQGAHLPQLDPAPHFLLASQFPVFMAAISILKLFLFGRESYSIWKVDSRVDAIIWNGMRITHDYIHGHQCQDMRRSLRAATGPDPNYR